MANTRNRVRKPSTVQVNTTGGAVRISPAASSRRTPRASQKAAVVVDVITPPVLEGFWNFLREHAVVGLAVGLIIGTQLKLIVDSLNTGFISPLFGLLFNGGALQNRISTVHWHGRSAQLAWGGVVYEIIDFVFIMLVVYLLIKLLHLDKLDKPKVKK